MESLDITTTRYERDSNDYRSGSRGGKDRDGGDNDDIDGGKKSRDLSRDKNPPRDSSRDKYQDRDTPDKSTPDKSKKKG